MNDIFPSLTAVAKNPYIFLLVGACMVTSLGIGAIYLKVGVALIDSCSMPDMIFFSLQTDDLPNQDKDNI